jgi:hypothetical protein
LKKIIIFIAVLPKRRAQRLRHDAVSRTLLALWNKTDFNFEILTKKYFQEDLP